MVQINGKYQGSTNGHGNGTHAKALPLPSNNRIAKLLNAVFRPSKNEEECLQKIADVWQSYLHHGLDARHQIGKLLNQQIGGPDNRQDRGKGVMALASERLGIAVSDLNRMRWTAHLFKSIKEMQKRHPEIDSWTRLKEALPGLMPRGRKKKVTTTSPAARFVKKVGRSIQGLKSAIKKSRVAVKPSEQDELLKQFRELAEVVEDKLQIRVTVSPSRVKLAS